MGLLAASTAGDALVVGIGRGAVLWRAGTATTLRGADDERCVAVAISGERRHGRGRRPTRSGCGVGTTAHRPARLRRRGAWRTLYRALRRRPGPAGVLRRRAVRVSFTGAGQAAAAAPRAPSSVLTGCYARRWTRGDRRPQREGAGLPVSPLRGDRELLPGATRTSSPASSSSRGRGSCPAAATAICGSGTRRPATASPSDASAACAPASPCRRPPSPSLRNTA